MTIYTCFVNNCKHVLQFSKVLKKIAVTNNVRNKENKDKGYGIRIIIFE